LQQKNAKNVSDKDLYPIGTLLADRPDGSIGCQFLPDFIISTKLPLCGMLYHAGTNHIHIGGLYARHGRVYNVFFHEPFFVDSLNRAVLEENRSIKTVSETFLYNFISNIN
jgi:hypothetical protein